MAAKENAHFASHLNEMLTGERAASITAGHVGGGYVVKGKDGVQRRFCGLLETMAIACFSDYDYDSARKTAGTPARLKSATGLSRPWHGVQRGRLVHDQVRAYVNAGGSATVSALFGNGKAHNSTVMQLTESFIASLHSPEINLKPLWAEFALYYEHIALASAIDLLCTRRNKETGLDELSLVEIKTGYENSFADGSGPLLNPPSLRHRNNSPLTQAFLQLAFYRQMVTHIYPNVRIGQCYVAQVRLADTVYHALPSDIIAASGDLLAHVAAARFTQIDRPSPRKRKRQTAKL
jgi:hypothetical protein